MTNFSKCIYTLWVTFIVIKSQKLNKFYSPGMTWYMSSHPVSLATVLAWSKPPGILQVKWLLKLELITWCICDIKQIIIHWIHMMLNHENCSLCTKMSIFPCSLWHQDELEQILNGIEFYNVLLSLLYQSTGVHLPSFKDYPNVKIISVFDSLGFLSWMELIPTLSIRLYRT